MPGGLSVSTASDTQFEAKITPIVIISCIMAATGGLMFGYDIGVSGCSRVPLRDRPNENPRWSKHLVSAQCHHRYTVRQPGQLWNQQSDSSLYSAVITGIVNVLSTVVSIYYVDRVGRRALLLESGVQMFLSHVIIAVIFGIKVMMDASNNLSHGYAILVLVMVCTFVSSFAWSWGPLGWLIPSETFPLEVRSAGQSIVVCVNFLFTFIFAQVFLSMLCHLKHAIFVFFSAWVVVMSVFMLFFLPETKNIPVEEMTNRVWKNHWFWKRYMDDDETIGLLSF